MAPGFGRTGNRDYDHLVKNTQLGRGGLPKSTVLPAVEPPLASIEPPVKLKLPPPTPGGMGLGGVMKKGGK